MQKGIAMLEIIFATMIFALLAKVAIPNAAYIIDSVSLDYEAKRLYSELRFVQELSRINTINKKGMGDNANIRVGSGAIPNLVIASDKKSYQIFRGPNNAENAIREPHYLANDVTITTKETMINFDSVGKANVNSITLTSRLGKKRTFEFDSVGRFRIEK